MRSYELAGAGDDATLRALLRDNVMPSWITMSLEREPSWFAGAGEHGREWAVVAREGAVPVGMYSCHEQSVFLNGEPVELGYLGALRVVPSHRNRLGLLREGYRTIRKLRQARGPELWFTSIASGNDIARRLLEANLPGMPRYRFLNELVTLAISKRRARSLRLWQPVAANNLLRFCDFHNEHSRRHQLAPWLLAETAARNGATCYAWQRKGDIAATMALWNRQRHHQIVVRGYRQPLRALRPVYNLYAHAAKRVVLPRAGESLEITYLAFLAISSVGEPDLEALIADALALSQTKILMLALHANHPWLPRICDRFRPERYHSRIYTVSFESESTLDARPGQPEVALL